MPKPFTIQIPEEQIDDLKHRLNATRWPDEIDNEKWEYGTNKSYLRELCNYWQQGYDWRAQEAYLNSFHHFEETIDDNRIHFIHHKGSGSVNIRSCLFTAGLIVLYVS